MTGQFEAYVLIGVYFFSLWAFMLTEPDVVDVGLERATAPREPDRKPLLLDDEDADGDG